MSAVLATGAALLWGWAAGLGVGLFVAVLVIALLNRVVRPALEISRYAGHIRDGGLGIARNLDGVDEAVRTRELATAVPELASAYLRKLGAAP